ncbi:hypothetical protein PENTCL1PPCAC_21939, partial [Pristionchus entomophagus]
CSRSNSTAAPAASSTTTSTIPSPATTTEKVPMSTEVYEKETVWVELKPSVYWEAHEPEEMYSFMSLKEARRSPDVQQTDPNQNTFGFLVFAIAFWTVAFIASP